MIRKETKEVLICDCCGRQSTTGILTDCPICKKENCLTCSSQLFDVWHTNICKCCLENQEIKAYYMNAWEKLWGRKRKKVVKEMQEIFSKEGVR